MSDISGGEPDARNFSSSCGNAGDPWNEEREPDPVPFTQAEAVRLFGPDVSRPSRVTPLRVVGAQVALSLVVTLVCGLLMQRPGTAALSALLGGALGWLPGALFALRAGRQGFATIGGWMIGEALKLGATIGMFVAIAYGMPDVRWVPLLVTYVLVLKVYWVALAWR